MIILLEPLEKATTYLSSASYPTIADIRFYFTELLKHFDYFMEKEDFSQNEVASSLYQKLEEYWIILHENSIIPTLLDPGTKLSLFESGRETSLAVSKMKDQINTYKTTSPKQPTITTQNTTKEYFRQLKRHRIGNNQQSSNQSTISNSELERYLALECNENISPLLWWQAHSMEFPILSEMARDYLSIQATSVASEQSFSIASNTLTKIRNRLHSSTARASLCLKSWIMNNLGEKNN